MIPSLPPSLRSPRRLALGVVLLLTLSCANSPGGEAPKRFMPFLARDAVIRESAETEPIAGKGASFTIVTGRIVSGARASNENADVAQAAKVLGDFLKKIADATPLEAGARKIVLHADGDPSALFPELKKADAHGFVIATRGRDLHIAGASGLGTLYGTWFFLQNYAGLRVLMQGELGEVFTRQEQVAIPKELYVFNPGPDFLLRIHSGLQDLDPTAWLQDKGDSQRFQYHHNAFQIYNPQAFGTSHPEYFPTVRGKRYIPPSTVKSGWQPVYSEPATVKRAIDYANEQFTANPELKSISLTPNDGGNWAEQDLQKASEKGVHPREIFYDHMNQVARGIQAKWPGRYVAALSYMDWQDPPSFPLEENCMIFIWTKDGNPQPVVDKWKGKVRRFGCYQWIYGMMYPFPNHWPHAIRDFLQMLRGLGANAFKTEFYDVHAHGCVRLWVLANLLWNADADVDALLRDYFEHAYGKEAAPAMARYFAQWEKVYERRRTPTEYNLVDRKGAERNFEPITEADLVACRQALDEATKLAVGDANRQRVDLVARLYERARLYDQMCRHLKALREGPETPATLAEGEAKLDAAAAMLGAEQGVYAWNVAKIEPAMTWCAMPARGAGEKNKPWAVDYLKLDPRILLVTNDAKWLGVDARIAAIARSVTSQMKTPAPPDRAAWWAQRAAKNPMLRAYAETERLELLHPKAPLANLLPNGSFELAAEPDSPEATRLLQDMRSFKIGWMDADKCQVPYVAFKGWNALENRCPQPVKVTRDPSEKHHGDAAVRVESVGQFGGVITQVTLPDPHARYRLSFWHKGTAGAKISYGTMFYQVRPVPYVVRTQDAAREWTRVEMEFPFNHDLARDEAPAISLWLGIWGGSPQAPVWFDDVRLERLSPEGVARESGQ